MWEETSVYFHKRYKFGVIISMEVSRDICVKINIVDICILLNLVCFLKEIAQVSMEQQDKILS